MTFTDRPGGGTIVCLSFDAAALALLDVGGAAVELAPEPSLSLQSART